MVDCNPTRTILSKYCVGTVGTGGHHEGTTIRSTQVQYSRTMLLSRQRRLLLRFMLHCVYHMPTRTSYGRLSHVCCILLFRNGLIRCSSRSRVKKECKHKNSRALSVSGGCSYFESVFQCYCWSHFVSNEILGLPPGGKVYVSVLICHGSSM